MSKWPKCRDSSVSSCDVSQDNPELPSEDLTVHPTDVSIAIGDKVEVRCRLEEDAGDDALSPITDAFTKLELVRT